MARQLGVGLLTKIARNGRPTNLLSPSPFLKPNATLSPSHFCTPNAVRASFQTTRFFSNALFKPPPKFPLAIRNRRSAHSFNSLDTRRRSIFRRFTTDGVVLGLIATNVAVFLLWKVADIRFMVKNFMLSVEHIKRGLLHTMITCAFSHRDTFHLVSNMIALYFFGTSIGQCFGPQFVLKLYLGGAVVGSIFYVVYQAFMAPPLQGARQGITNLTVPCLGASGAVNAIMLLDIFLFPRKTIFLEFIIPVPAALVGAFLIGRDMLRAWEGDKEVSGAGHLGGMTVAVFAWLRNRKGRFGRF